MPELADTKQHPPCTWWCVDDVDPIAYRQEPGRMEVVYLHVYRPSDNEHLFLDSSVHLTINEARQLADELLEVVDEIVEGRNPAPLTAPSDTRLVTAKTAVLEAYNTLKQTPGNVGDYLRAALDSITDAIEVLQ